MSECQAQHYVRLVHRSGYGAGAAVTRDMLHPSACLPRGQGRTEAVHGPAPSRDEPHNARERQYACHRGRREDRDSVLLEKPVFPDPVL